MRTVSMIAMGAAVCLCVPGGVASCGRSGAQANADPREAGNDASVADTGESPLVDAEDSVFRETLPRELQGEVEDLLRQVEAEHPATAEETAQMEDHLQAILPDASGGDRERELAGAHFFVAQPVEAVAFVAAKLADPSADTRQSVFYAVAYLTRPKAGDSTEATLAFEATYLVPLCLRSLYDVHPQVRDCAVGALGNIAFNTYRDPEERVLAALRDALDDEDPQIVRTAARALYRIGQRDGIPPALLEEFRTGAVVD